MDTSTSTSTRSRIAIIVASAVQGMSDEQINWVLFSNYRYLRTDEDRMIALPIIIAHCDAIVADARTRVPSSPDNDLNLTAYSANAARFRAELADLQMRAGLCISA